MKATQQVFSALLCVAGLSLCVSACGNMQGTVFDPKKNDLIDPARGLSREDYKEINNMPALLGDKNGNTKVTATVSAPPIPDLAEILAAPKPPKLGETQLVSIAVTDDVPLKDVLIELGRLANVDMQVDSGIIGGISFRAKDRPFNEVIDRICEMAGLRYKTKNSVLSIERDTPYIEIYSLNLLNLDRSSQGNIGVNTTATSTGSSTSGSASAGGGGAATTSSASGSGSSSSSTPGGGINSGSTSSITAKADSDFWKQFEESVKQILAYAPVSRLSSTTIASQPATPASGATASAAGTAAPAPTPAAMGSVAATRAAGDGTTPSGEKSFFILNRQASTLTVSATEKQHEIIKQFIRKIEANSSSQVLIEAKIVEVDLDDEYQSGINWTKFGTKTLGVPMAFGAVPDATNNSASITVGKLNIGNFDLAGVVKLVETFGATRTLSSPRLNATNNQQAVLSFAQNVVYYELQINNQTNTSTAGSLQTNQVTSILHTVPIGIILTLQPSIDSETNEITLSVRPTLSRIVGEVTDPAVAYAAAQANINLTNQTPIVEVRELDSILKLKSGQVMVIGGLMQDKSTNTDSGLPGFAGIPWLGNLFKGVSKANTVSELVIFIRATIVSPNGDAAPADKAVYEKYIPDTRPLTF